MSKINHFFEDTEIIHYDHVSSTNTEALNLIAKSNPNEGTVISSYHQSDGKGQIGSKWYSTPHQNIALTMILYPTFLRPLEQFLISKIASLAVVQAIKEIAPTLSPKIKWPNDIYINDLKIAGILIQNQIQTSSIQSSIIGIGLNVNEKNFPAHLPNPTSLTLETRKEFHLNQIVPRLKHHLLAYYHQATAVTERPLIHQQYLALLYRRNKWAFFKTAQGSIFQGMIVGINDHGQLAILIDGQKKYFSNKEVSYIKEN